MPLIRIAVVATEVRNLAQRSASAAREIKALISESVEQVESGSRQVDAAGRKMQDVVQAAQHVSNLIAEIATASQEQSSGIEQVNAAVTALEQGVQQNASLVEEAAAATESMKAQAAGLHEAVVRFRLDDEAPATAELAGPERKIPAAMPRIQTRASPPAQERMLPPVPAHSAPAGDWRTF